MQIKYDLFEHLTRGGKTQELEGIFTFENLTGVMKVHTELAVSVGDVNVFSTVPLIDKDQLQQMDTENKQKASFKLLIQALCSANP